METNLRGRVALITGASLGLGLAMAKALYTHGARVALLARRAEPLESAEQEIRATQPIHSGGDVACFTCDVADLKQIQVTHAEVVSRFGNIDILINNAGKASAKPFLAATEEDWQEDIDLKLLAAVRLTKLVWPAMENARRGRIINLLNTAAKAPSANSAPTSVTRAAGMALTKVLSAEGAPHGILVNAMLIGYIKSDQIRRLYESSGGEQTLEEFIAAAGARLPMGRMGEAEEVANLALFLASDAASYITGCAINMDGGLSKVV